MEMKKLWNELGSKEVAASIDITLLIVIISFPVNIFLRALLAVASFLLIRVIFFNQFHLTCH